MISEYVLGFYFDNKNHVVLIDKKDFLNGIGGKIKNKEGIAKCMEREFKEETGCEVLNWEYTTTIKGDHYVIYCFRSFGEELSLISSAEGLVENVDLNDLCNRRLAPFLSWLIPSHLDKDMFKNVLIENSLSEQG